MTLNVTDTGPLTWNSQIVSRNGTPSPEFQRKWDAQRNNNSSIGLVDTGSGAPTGVPKGGQEYVDTSTTPLTLYTGVGGVWKKTGAYKFTDLSDVPHSYTSSGNDLVTVNSGATALQFTTLSTALDVLGSAEGSVLYRGSSLWTVLGPGTSGQVLTTGGASAVPSWTTITSGVTSVFGRTGAVVAQTGDYTAAQVTNAVATNVANTFTVSPQTISAPSGGNSFVIQSNAACLFSMQRFQANASSPVIQSTKGRGSVASPAAVANGDQIFNFLSLAQASSSVTVSCAGLMTKVIEPTPSTTAMGTQWLMSMCPVGSISNNTFLTADWTNGLQISGVQIVNASGVLQIPATAVTPGSYTNTNLTVGADGRITAASNGSGGGGGQHEYEAFGALPLAATFTSVNAQSSTLTDSSLSLVLATPSVGGQPSTIWQKAAPGATPWNVYARVQTLLANGRGGIGVRATATGKITSIQINGGQYAVYRETINAGTSTFGATQFSQVNEGTMPNWLRINNDGTNLNFMVSMDGVSWAQIYTETIAAWVASADNIGLSFAAPSSGTLQMWVGSFSTSAPT